jgi:non-heme chloroperoxidase
LRATLQAAAGSGAYADLACIDSWLTDFRGDLAQIDVPVLAIHGVADRIAPLGVTAARLRDEHLVDDLTVVEIPDGPHMLCWTHPDEVNSALLSFLASEAGDRPAEMAATG